MCLPKICQNGQNRVGNCKDAYGMTEFKYCCASARNKFVYTPVGMIIIALYIMTC